MGFHVAVQNLIAIVRSEPDRSNESEEEFSRTDFAPPRLHVAVSGRELLPAGPNIAINDRRRARQHPFSKAGGPDLRQHGFPTLGVIGVEALACSLGHHLSQQDARNNGKARKMVAEELLVRRDGLHGLDVFARHELENFVYENESHGDEC